MRIWSANVCYIILLWRVILYVECKGMWENYKCWNNYRVANSFTCPHILGYQRETDMHVYTQTCTHTWLTIFLERVCILCGSNI